MNLKKATDGKKTWTGIVILALTPAISVVLQNLGLATEGSELLSAEIAGYIVGGFITVVGIIHKLIKRKEAKKNTKK